MYRSSSQKSDAINLFERIPSLDDNSIKSDIRFEYLLEKLSENLRGLLQRFDHSRFCIYN